MKLSQRILAICLALVLILTACGGPKTAQAWQEQYDLGLRYLSECNYEEAIIAFTAAIEIAPKRDSAYYQRARTYHCVADAVSGGTEFAFLSDFVSADEKLEHCYTSAIVDLEKAIELQPGVPEYYDEIMQVALAYGDIDLMLRYGALKYQNTDDKSLFELYQAAQESLALLADLAEAFKGGADEDVFALMQGERYESLLSLQSYLNRPILRHYEGKTLGVYRVEDPKFGHCMLYFGDLADGLRQGSGKWYGYSDGNNYASGGTWQADKPEGYFETKEWYSGLAEDVVYRLVSGNVSGGLWNGSVLWAFDATDGYTSWDCSFTNGVANIVEVEHHDDGEVFYVWSKTSNEGRESSLGDKAEEEALKTTGIAGFVKE